MKGVFQKAWPDAYRPAIQRTGKVTATSLGPVLNGFVSLPETMYGYPNSIIKANAIAFASCIKRRPEHVECSTMPAFVHSQWSRGYYHWITESLPRAIAVASKTSKATVYLPHSYDSFHLESLKLLGIKHTHFPSHNISVDRAFVTSCPKHYGTTAGDLIVDMREKLKKRVLGNANFGRKIYVSRRHSRGRKVSNETEVIKMLSSYGFEVLAPENYSFEDQVAIFSNVEFIIGIHGAGLTNMVFMEEGSSIIELLPFRNGIVDIRPNTLSMKHDNCYVSLANSLALRYGYLQCSHDKKWYQRTNLANINVDCAKLAALLEACLARSTKE